MKIKTLLHTLIISHFGPIIKALSKIKSLVIKRLNEYQLPKFYFLCPHKKHSHMQKKIFFGSFRLHYNWCSSRYSSHVLPMPSSPIYDGCSNQTHNVYHDPTWNDDSAPESQLSGYLEWLEEKDKNGKMEGNYNGGDDDINKLADIFIASCHEKFMLEKQESYRRFQEMLARGV